MSNSSGPGRFTFDNSSKALLVSSSGAGVSDVNIADIAGSPVALSNPLPVELSDGTNPLGTASNPISDNIAKVGGNSVSTAATGVMKVGVVGNGGTAFDGATGATAPTNALQVGAAANVGTSLPTAVTNGQLVAPMGDKYGRQVTLANGQRGLIGTQAYQSTSSSYASFIAAGGSNVFNDLITLIFTNEGSSATIVSLNDNSGSGGNTYLFALAANGGIVINFPTPLPQGSSNASWQVKNSAGNNVDCVAVYVKNQ